MASDFPSTIRGSEGIVYETGTQQRFPIGQKLETPSGAIFRYTELGELGVANNLYQGEAPKANWLTQAAATALVVGDKTIAFTDGGTSYGANDFVGGTILVEETDDKGHIYPIKSHPLSSGTVEVVFTLVDGVTVQNAVAVAANNVLTLLKNPWKDVIISPAGINTALNVGIPRIVIASGSFGWLQTRGAASCLIEQDATGGDLLVGNECRASNEVAGAVSILDEVAGDAEYQHVGVAMETAPTADFGHIWLTLE